MPGGYTGWYLNVDLTSGETSDIPMPPEEAINFLGGKGVAALLLHRLLPQGVDPLSPKNVVIINTGPLTASGTPGSSRFNLSTKSPPTGGIATSNCGGMFGLYLKRAGYDGLILRGKAANPVWLEIDEAGAKLKDASDLWGKGALEVQKSASKNEGTLAIGPAGENLVKFAAVMSGERALARCGGGAVLGSKNLKGATVKGKGSNEAPISDPSALKEARKLWAQALTNNMITGELLQNYGTAVLLNRCDVASLLPTRNFQSGSFVDAENISGESMESLVVGHGGCYACPVRCGRVVEGPNKSGHIRGPEYETLALMGSNLCISSLDNIIEWNYLCDELGLDTISTGAVLGMAMELGERGLLKTDLCFGNPSNVSRTIEDIAYRRRLGGLLAEGVRALGERCGMPQIAPHSKGLELPGYHPRNAFGQALGYATSNRGGCHLNGGYMAAFEGAGNTIIDPWEWRGKADLTIFLQNLIEAVSAAGGCLFSVLFLMVPPYLGEKLFSIRVPYPIARILTYLIRPLVVALTYLPKRALFFHPPISNTLRSLEAITGSKFSLGRFLETGERIYNLERLFNLREGMSSREDMLPGRMIRDDNGVAGENVPLDLLVPAFYRKRGWDTNGFPLPKTKRRLGLTGL